MSRILFVITPNRGWDGKLGAIRFPHTGIGYMSAYLKERGFETCVVDTSLDFPHMETSLQDALVKHKPDIVGVSVYSSLEAEATRIVSHIQSLTSVPIVAGGPHISVTNKDFLEKTGIRFGVMREGEIPLHKLMSALSNNASEEDLRKIPGLIFKSHTGEYIVQENTDLINNLDEIPFPDFSIFDVDKYAAWRDRRYEIITSRGCPYGCTFCAVPLVTGRKHRVRSPGNVVNEIEMYVKQGFKRFGVMDDDFNADIDRAKEVCRLIIARKLDIAWDMGNGIRANTTDREFFQLLKKAGCNFVGFGLEAGSPEMLRRIKKGLTIDQMYKALEYANEVGVGSAVNLIVGHPGETYQSAMETLALAQKLPASYVNIFGWIPFKGTEAFIQFKVLEAKGEARFLYDYDYYISHFSPQGIEPVIETKELSREQRRKLLILGRNITKKSALKYRFGKILGSIAYVFAKNDAGFNALNRLRNTPLGSWLYHRIRHED